MGNSNRYESVVIATRYSAHEVTARVGAARRIGLIFFDSPRLHADKTTALDGTIKVGDKVEAQAMEKNHAVSIKHVQPKM